MGGHPGGGAAVDLPAGAAAAQLGPLARLGDKRANALFQLLGPRYIDVISLASQQQELAELEEAEGLGPKGECFVAEPQNTGPH